MIFPVAWAQALRVTVAGVIFPVVWPQALIGSIIASGDISRTMGTGLEGHSRRGDISCGMATGLNWPPQSPVVIFPILWPQALMVTVASGNISSSMATVLDSHSRQR